MDTDGDDAGGGVIEDGEISVPICGKKPIIGPKIMCDSGTSNMLVLLTHHSARIGQCH